ncbi:MAG: helix-turn-helix domain-containing protein, partial [Gemmiger sp.]|nr:helix-turn-helix domain-containing protein [Gemmiger sp.]
GISGKIAVGGENMLLNEKLKELRHSKGISQEKAAELIGVSRQAVAKWESGQTLPSSENLILLASVYGISLDELATANNADKGSSRENKILQSNLTLMAIIFQAGALIVCLQPRTTAEYGLPFWFLLLFKLVPLAAWSIWMARNLRYEKNKAQYRKNARIELAYCAIQWGIVMVCHFSGLAPLGTAGVTLAALLYIFVVNPRYMNRVLTKEL